MATDDPDTITLGLLSLSHLGDALCTTSLPRRLTLEQGLRVEVVRHPSTARHQSATAAGSFGS